MKTAQLLQFRLSLCLLSPLAAATTSVRFADALPEDSIVVRYSSLGCFHSYSFELTFTPSANGSIVIDRLESHPTTGKGRQMEPARKRLGRIMLEPGEKKMLDSLLNFYRSKPAGSWTTTNTIEVRQMRRGRLIADERFVESAGPEAWPEDMLRFESLVDALERTNR